MALPTTKVDAQELYVGSLQLTAAIFCPRGWMEANGQRLPIEFYTELFSVLGTHCGGNGRTDFALPDLRGRAPIHFGTGPGLSNYALGQSGGQEDFTLTTRELPRHNHMVNATNAQADRHGPGTDLLATTTYQDGTKLNIYSNAGANKQMNPAMIENTGDGLSKAHRGPYLAMRWCIAVTGNYPPRD